MSLKTITWYDVSLRRFLGQHQHPTEISQLNISHLRAWLRHGQEWDLSPYTVQGQARTLKSFFRFAPEEGYLETDIASRLGGSGSKEDHQTFSEEQLRQLLASARSTRDKAILGLFINTGIRESEAEAVARVRRIRPGRSTAGTTKTASLQGVCIDKMPEPDVALAINRATRQRGAHLANEAKPLSTLHPCASAALGI